MKKKDTRKRNALIALILFIVMVISTFGYAFVSKDHSSDSGALKKLEYKGVRFDKLGDGYWHFSINNKEFQTLYNPKELENITIPFNLRIEDYLNKPLYFVEDDSRPSFEIKRNFFDIVLRINGACLIDNCTKDFPVKNCSVDNVFIYEYSNQSEIKKKERCIFISGSLEEQIKFSDSVIFKLLGLK